ncbi:MAG: Dodecin (COG3360) Flavin-binding, partial [uncultured Nocardioidaceae bacterium]
DQPHLPRHRDRRDLARRHRPGHPQRRGEGRPDAPARRLVRDDRGAWAGQGRHGRALPGRSQDRLPPRGRL